LSVCAPARDATAEHAFHPFDELLRAGRPAGVLRRPQYGKAGIVCLIRDRRRKTFHAIEYRADGHMRVCSASMSQQIAGIACRTMRRATT
jgi:hypothetical protein